MKALGKKDYYSRMVQTDDLVDEELMKQLKEYKAKYGAKIYGNRVNKGATIGGFGSSIDVKASIVNNQECHYMTTEESEMLPMQSKGF